MYGGIQLYIKYTNCKIIDNDKHYAAFLAWCKF